MTHSPILWSFRRCPYAMRARLAILSAGLQVELRDIQRLRDKPQAFLDTSPTATVPCLNLGTKVIDESLDIMIWALEQRDPQQLLDMPAEGWELIARNDGPFKAALDHSKYATRYPDLNPDEEREKAAAVLFDLNRRLSGQAWLLGAAPRLADFAILPFVRQFAFIDRAWFDAQDWPHMRGWLDRFLTSPAFATVMEKHSPWAEDTPPIWFGGA
ncbi:maleylacetoacetate isomerase [Tritonibacter multivorans]|uniref:Maleylacetoacetate isomerase n=1 Tax=Tritonibacter multivorans TaxID=928856 RepID=A0A0N7M0D6_9RHOB|nr:glutathione S-transferase [Tritonibacter multivorans]MDA7421102.1 glutathione S-transferase [Tritonibacter multivorans]CUH80169.1 maleylacetoacetate isomerase [Tritonibacter multivorans]SFC75197.1 Glutathione S-transferase [Tritonibacter multivorans]